MKRRIFAWIGILFIPVMFLISLILSIINAPIAGAFLIATIVLSVVIPGGIFLLTRYPKDLADMYHNIKGTKKDEKDKKDLIPCNIALIGFMGCGKSTVAAYLQKMLGLDLAEIDEMIEEQEGMTIPEIFEKHGEEYFRTCETNMVIELQKRERTIISCGGGLVMRQVNVDNLKKHSRIVLLTAKPETIYERVRHDNNRPILNGNMNVEYIAQLMEKRREKYEAAADIIIETDQKPVSEICEELVKKVCEMGRRSV